MRVLALFFFTKKRKKALLLRKDLRLLYRRQDFKIINANCYKTPVTVTNKQNSSA
jgi:hypothetical protein